jgi:hypothetical protein
MIVGSDLRDERTFLAFRGPAAEGPAVPAERSFRVNTGDGNNPDWAFSVRDPDISFSVMQTVQDDQGTGLTLYPGLFSIRVVTARRLPNDPLGRFLEQSGNSLVFAIVPQIVTVSGLGGPPNASQFRLTLFGSYLRDELDIQLSVAGQVLQRAAPATTAGNYDFTPNTGQIDFAVDTTNRTSPLPVSLVINGANATPGWAVF